MMNDRELLFRVKEAAQALELSALASARRDGFGSQAKLLEAVAVIGQVTTELITRKETVWWKRMLMNFVSVFIGVLAVQLLMR